MSPEKSGVMHEQATYPMGDGDGQVTDVTSYEPGARP